MGSVEKLLLITLLIGLSSCEDGKCPLPSDWKLAKELSPSPVPYTPLPILSAQEKTPGNWLWRGASATIGYEKLVSEVALASELNPQPRLLFKFADGHSCADLNKIRQGIAKSAKCSREGMLCIEGMPAELP